MSPGATRLRAHPESVQSFVGGEAPRPPFGVREVLAALFRYRRKILLTFAACVAAALVGTLLQSKTYEAQSRILVQQNRPQMQVGGNLSGTGPVSLLNRDDEIRTEVQIMLSPETLRMTVESLGAQSILERVRWRWDWVRELPRKAISEVRGWFFSDAGSVAVTPVYMAMEKLRQHLTVEPVRDTNVFAVQFQAPDPVYAAEVVNVLVDRYREHHIALRQRAVSTDVFSVEAERLDGELRAAVERLESYKRETGIVSAESQKQLLLDRLSAAQAMVGQTDLQQAETVQRIAELRRQLQVTSKNVRPESVSSANALSDTLRQQLAQLEAERAQFVDGSPVAAQLDRDIGSVRARIAEQQARIGTGGVSGETYQEIEKLLAVETGQLSGLRSRSMSIKQVEALKQEVATLDRFGAELAELQRAVVLKEEALLAFRRKEEEARVNGLLDVHGVTNVVPMERATANYSAVSPKRLLNILGGVMAGLFGGALIAVLSEYWRRSFVNREEVEQAMQRRVLGSIREQSGDSTAGVSNMVELRRIAEGLLRLRREGRPSVVMFASSLAGEGCSFVCKSVAQALSIQGCRVLLLSAGTPSGQEAATRITAVPQATRDANVWQIDEGAFAVGGNSLAWVERIGESIAGHRARFDYVFVDAPPLGADPEAALLASKIDHVIVVVEAERTPGMTLGAALRSLEAADASILGIVLNRRRHVIPEWAYRWFLSPQQALSKDGVRA